MALQDQILVSQNEKTYFTFKPQNNHFLSYLNFFSFLSIKNRLSHTIHPSQFPLPPLLPGPQHLPSPIFTPPPFFLFKKEQASKKGQNKMQ